MRLPMRWTSTHTCGMLVTVRMAGLMAYTLTEDRGVDLPDTGMDTRENKGCKEAAGVHSCAGRRGTVFSLPSGVASCLLWASYASTRSARSIL